MLMAYLLRTTRDMYEYVTFAALNLTIFEKLLRWNYRTGMIVLKKKRINHSTGPTANSFVNSSHTHTDGSHGVEKSLRANR